MRCLWRCFRVAPTPLSYIENSVIFFMSSILLACSITMKTRREYIRRIYYKYICTYFFLKASSLGLILLLLIFVYRFDFEFRMFLPIVKMNIYPWNVLQVENYQSKRFFLHLEILQRSIIKQATGWKMFCLKFWINKMQ